MPGKVKRKWNGEQSREVKWFGWKLVSEHCFGIMELWIMVWLVCCSQLLCCFQAAPGCSLTGSVSPGGTKGTCVQVWGGSEPLGSISRACIYVGDWTASHVGAPPFWVTWRISHVSAPPWRMGGAWASPSWMVGHLRVPPSWNWARWWAKGSLQVMCCVGTAPVRFSVQLVLIGIALVLKVMDWGPRVTI